MVVSDKKVEFLVADTTAFIENAPLQNIAHNVVTIQEVVNEITSKRQLRRLVVLPYDLIIKDVFPENIQFIMDFAQKTGDYPSLSATDIKVIALTYQLEKAEVGVQHLRKEPLIRKTIVGKPREEKVSGFFLPKQKVGSASQSVSESGNSENQQIDLIQEIESLNIQSEEKNLLELVRTDNLNVLPESENGLHALHDSESKLDDLILVKHNDDLDTSENEYSDSEDDDNGWITPSNIDEAKKQINSENLEEKIVKVACMTTDFAMQNVLKQMNLNVSALDGRIIKQLKTYILRCYTCFQTTSIMTQRFCPKCGNATLKRVSVSVDSEGKQKIHINARRPLTARGKKFSLPTVHGGKHSQNPVLSADQPLPDQKPTRLARMKNNPLDDDYVAGFSPFVTRDVNSKSAQLGIRNAKEVKHWMRKNPNEVHRKRK